MAQVDYSQLMLRRCSPAQQRATRKNHFGHWGKQKGFKDEDTYVALRGVKLNEPFVERGEYISWALVPRDDPETTDLRAHCETYRCNAIMLRPGSGTVEDVYCYAVSGVFSPIKYRGCGYARAMLRMLHYVVGRGTTWPDAWGERPKGFSDGAFSVLFSEVGARFYTESTLGDGSAGWAHYPVTTRIWPVPHTGELEVDGVQWIAAEEVSKLEPVASAYIRKHLSETGNPSKTRVAILPDAGWFKVHSDRYSILPNARPGRTGAVLLPSTGEQVMLVYALVPNIGKPGTKLAISYMQGDVPFSAALAAARREGADELEMWAEYTGWDTEEGMRTETDHHTPCLAAYGIGEVEWLWNDKYAWC